MMESDHWQRHWRIWRTQFTVRLMRHHYSDSALSDRWVLQTNFVYDRKAQP